MVCNFTFCDNVIKRPMLLQQTTFEVLWQKGEIAYNKQFLLLPQCFKVFPISKLSVIVIFSPLLQICCNWEREGLNNSSK